MAANQVVWRITSVKLLGYGVGGDGVYVLIPAIESLLRNTDFQVK